MKPKGEYEMQKQGEEANRHVTKKIGVYRAER